MKSIPLLRSLLLLAVSGLPAFAQLSAPLRSPASAKTVSLATANPDNDIRKRWEASPDGRRYKAWETSPEGKKVRASHDKIRKQIQNFSAMEAVVTSLHFQRPQEKPTDTRWLIVNIGGEKYMMQFSPKEFARLSGLMVDDTITLRSRSAGLSPNHPFLILSADYIAHKKKLLFKRAAPKNNGC